MAASGSGSERQQFRHIKNIEIRCLLFEQLAITKYASRRLGVILRSYTVYLDLWIADASGTVIANGRPEQYPSVVGSDVSETAWFRAGMDTASGDDFAAIDVETVPVLHGGQVATYATAVRTAGRADGAKMGVLGIFFDWQPQAASIVNGVRLSDEERPRTRCLLIDARHA
jgi:hypothetical protein